MITCVLATWMAWCHFPEFEIMLKKWSWSVTFNIYFASVQVYDTTWIMKWKRLCKESVGNIRFLRGWGELFLLADFFCPHIVNCKRVCIENVAQIKKALTSFIEFRNNKFRNVVTFIFLLIGKGVGRYWICSGNLLMKWEIDQILNTVRFGDE